MRSEGRGCDAGNTFSCRRKKKNEGRPVPKPVRNLNDGEGRGCGFPAGEGRGCGIAPNRGRKKETDET